MPAKRAVDMARGAKRGGKATTTQAGQFVHEEIRDIRAAKHGARSLQQAIAIGPSKASRAGVALLHPKRGRAKDATRRSPAICPRGGAA